MHWIKLAIILAIFLAPAHVTTQLIDDADPRWTYEGLWNPNCASCTLKPDQYQVYHGTWHDTVGFGSSASISLSEASSVTVVIIEPPNTPTRDWFTEFNLVINNGTAIPFHFSATTGDYIYNISAQSSTLDPCQDSSVQIVNARDSGLLLDYIIVEQGHCSSTRPFHPSTTLPASSQPSTTTTPTSTSDRGGLSKSDKINIGIGFASLIVAIIGVFAAWKGLQKRSENQEKRRRGSVPERDHHNADLRSLERDRPPLEG